MSFLNFLTTFVWPVTTIALAIIFKKDISNLIEKRKITNSVEDNKWEFDNFSTSFGYVESQMDKIIEKSESKEVNFLINEIKDTTQKLQGIHPISLAILIEMGEGIISSSSWKTKTSYLIELQKKSFICLEPKVDTADEIKFYKDNRNNTSARLTKKGNEFLDKIGFRDTIS